MPARHYTELDAIAAPLKRALDPELAGLVDDIIGIADMLDADDRLQAAEDMASNLRKLINRLADDAMAEYDRRNGNEGQPSDPVSQHHGRLAV